MNCAGNTELDELCW